MSTLDLIITHDTEDVYFPAESGRDIVIKNLADIYSTEGVPANFMLIARRATLLKERGREDVIAALKRHSVGVHTLSHDQPVAAVQAAGVDWDEGLEICRRMETEAYRTVARALDCKPVCLSSHHMYEAPQNYVVARELGLPYVYGWQVAPPLFNISRCCGTLNFPYEGPQTGPNDTYLPYFDGFDDALSNVPDFDAHLERFARHIDACLSARQPLLLIHPCHPVKTYSIDWIDHYLTPNGVTLTPEERQKRPGPGIRTPGEGELTLRNFRRLVQFIRHHPHLNVLSIPEATAKYGRPPAEISRLDLYAAAQRILALNEVVIEAQYTPAEVIMGFAEGLLSLARLGQLPDSLPRQDVFGPLEDPLIIPEAYGPLGWQSLLGLAAALIEKVGAAGHLPANLRLPGGEQIGLGSLYRALAEYYMLTCRDGRPPESVTLVRFDRQPRVGPAIGKQFLLLAESPLVVPNVNVDHRYRQAKLQTWALAPAWQA